jgi:zinc/manganese transport system substrate-binding protein
MTVFRTPFLLATLLFALAWPAPAAARLTVAATVPDLAALAREVAGARAEVFSLTLPTQDPHFVDARPHLALQLSRADLLLVVGLDLEVGWLPVLLTGSRNPAIQTGSKGYLDCSTVVELKEVPRKRIDRSEGDIHPGGNPHYLVAPDNARRVVDAVAARLTQLDPAGAATYAANARAFSDALAKARGRWAEKMKPYQGAAVVAYHRSWIYLADTLGLRIADHLEPKPGIPPNAAHVMHVIQLMRATGIGVLLQEEYYPDRTAQLVCQKTGARLVILAGGARVREGESYLVRMDKAVARVASALAGKGG